MKQQVCLHCQRPLQLMVCCRYCGKECEGMKAETLILIVGGLLVFGILVGMLLTFVYV